MEFLHQCLVNESLHLLRISNSVTLARLDKVKLTPNNIAAKYTYCKCDHKFSTNIGHCKPVGVKVL